jgi:hypothetical protein
MSDSILHNRRIHYRENWSCHRHNWQVLKSKRCAHGTIEIGRHSRRKTPHDLPKTCRTCARLRHTNGGELRLRRASGPQNCSVHKTSVKNERSVRMPKFDDGVAFRCRGNEIAGFQYWAALAKDGKYDGAVAVGVQLGGGHTTPSQARRNHGKLICEAPSLHLN